MAKIRRAGFGTVFNIENEKVGIGTTGKFFTEVRVLKNIELSDANVVTQAQLENYQGFLSNEARLSGNDVDLNKLVGYVRGEAYYGESHAHTQDDGTVVNMVGSAHTTFSHNVIDDSSNIQSGAMGDIIIDGEFTVSSGTTYCSSVDQLTSVANFTVPTGDTDDRIHCHTAGSMRFNEDLGTLEFYTGDEWKTVNSFKDTGNRGRGVFSGFSPGFQNKIVFVEITTLGDALDFGTNETGVLSAGTSNGIRGVFSGGAPAPYKDKMEYITIASQGNTIDFGDLTQNRGYAGGASSSTRGLVIGGYFNPAYTNIIDYHQISTLGDAIDFGDTRLSGKAYGATGSPIKAVFVNGSATSDAFYDTVQISTLGNSRGFGEMTQKRAGGSGGGNSVRGIFSGGYLGGTTHKNTIDYVTFASEGNAIDFGDRTFTGSYSSAVSNSVRVVNAGAFTPSALNIMEFITIATTGNAQDFGDCPDGSAPGSVSDSHGGLGGF